MKTLWIIGLLLAGGCQFEGAAGIAAGEPGDGDGDPGGEPEDPDAGEPDPEPAVGRLLVPRTETPPNVETYEAEDWAGLDRARLEMSGAEHKHINIAGYTEDAVIEFAAVHDSDYLYFLVELTDDESFEGDGVELYFDAAGDRSGEYQADDSFAFVPTSGQVRTTSDLEIDGIIRSLEGADHVYVLRVAKTSMAGALPERLGFNISVWDDDDGSGVAGWGLWHEPEGPHCADCCPDDDHGEPWCDTTMLGELVLLP